MPSEVVVRFYYKHRYFHYQDGTGENSAAEAYHIPLMETIISLRQILD